MKKWLKKHGKWVVVGLGVLFIANGSYGITVTSEWKLVLHICVVIIWLSITLCASGAFESFFQMVGEGLTKEEE